MLLPKLAVVVNWLAARALRRKGRMNDTTCASFRDVCPSFGLISPTGFPSYRTTTRIGS